MSDVYLRLYVGAVKSGIIAEMGTELFSTLTVIASFMDADGRCYPTQASIGRMLGVNRQTANKYVQRLLAYRKDGEPLVTVEKERGTAGTFGRNVYTIHPVSGFAIF